MNAAYLINTLADVYTFLILIYCLFTWFPMQQEGIIRDVFEFVRRLVEPYLNIFKKFIPPIGGTLDISPILALLVLQLLVRFVTGLLH